MRLVRALSDIEARKVQTFVLLGGVLTTLISASESEVRPILQLPEPWGVYAMVPLGYPKGNHGPLRRAPLEHMVKFDVWSD